MKINFTKSIRSIGFLLLLLLAFGFQSQAQLTYCAASNTDPNGQGSFISNVTFGAINNTTGNTYPTNGYAYFPTQTTTVILGSNENLTITIGGPAASYTGGIVSVWVDWNQDGTLSASEWQQVSTNIASGASQTISLAIPATATPGSTRMRIRSRGTGNPNGASDACSSMGSGDTEDYDIIVSAGSPCTNPPNAGTIATSVPDSVCPSVAFGLSVTGSTIGTGMTYQWQSATVAAGPWTDIVGATNLSYNIAAGITTATYYRLKSICSGGTPVYSNAKQITIKSFINCYCNPTYTQGCNNGSHIGSFSTTGASGSNITNLNTGCASGGLGYSNYTSQTVSGMQGTTFNFTVAVASYSGGVKLWVDWNQNGVFDATTELVAASTSTISSGSSFTGTGTIPLTATPGNTRLRVMVVESSSSFVPCGSYGYGETEDYTFNVIQAAPCVNPPSAGTVNGPDSVCANVAFMLTNTGFTLGTGMTYQWQRATAAAGPWTDIAGATNSSYNNPGITAATYFRLKVTCNTGTPEYSAAKYITMKSILNCYCNPTGGGGSTSYYINSITTTGGTTNLNYAASSYNAYVNATATQVVSQLPGQSFTTNVNVASGGSHYYQAWIDWNANGSFGDPGENVYSLTSYTNPPVSFTVTVPAAQAGGTYRMRLASDWLGNATSNAYCGNMAYGGMVDVNVNVVTTPCTNPANAGTVTGPDSVCANTSFTLNNTGYTVGVGTSYQWQSAPAATGPWTDIVGATSTSYTNAAGINVPTFYRLKVTCSTGTPVYSNVKGIQLNLPFNCPCIPIYTWGCSSGATINGFTTTNAFVNIANTNTGCTNANLGYTDYANTAALNISAVQSTTFNVAVNVSNYSGGVKIWADWNQDGVFDPVNELVAASTSTVSAGSTFNSTITVPVTSNLGATRLRVRVVESSTNFNPCSSYSYGETEDYKIIIHPMPDCSAAVFPTTSTLNANVTTFCAYSDVIFSLSPNMPPASSLEYIWESSPTATGPWTTVGTTQIPNFTAVGVTQTAYYRVRLICNGTEIRNFGTRLITVTNPGSLVVTSGEKCGPGSVTLTATPVNPAHTVEWYSTFTGGTALGTGTTFNTPPLSATTIYFAKAVGTGLSGCAAQRTPVYAYIRPLPQPYLGLDIDTCTSGPSSPVILNVGTQPAGSSILWQDGSTGTTYNVTSNGTYIVTVTNEYNCVGKDTISVNIKQNPVVDITANGTSICEGAVKVLDAGPDGENGGNYYWTSSNASSSANGATTRFVNVNVSGTYIVYVTSSEGCVTTDTANMIVAGQMPSIDAIVPFAQTALNFNFTAYNPQNIVDYIWNFGDGTNPVTTTVPTVDHLYTSGGNFWVKLTTNSTCGSNVDSVLISIIGVGVNDVDKNNQIKVYPNPTAGKAVFVETDGNIKINTIKVYNIIGQEVYNNSKLENTNKHQILFGNHLPAGVYNIKLDTDKGIMTKKLEILK